MALFNEHPLESVLHSHYDAATGLVDAEKGDRVTDQHRLLTVTAIRRLEWEGKEGNMQLLVPALCSGPMSGVNTGEE